MRALALAAASAASGLAQTFTVQLPDSIALANTPVVWEKRLAAYCEGPAWEASTGSVYFTEQRGGANWPIWKFRPGTADTGSVFVATRQSNGLEFDPQGRLVAAQDGRIARYRADGSLDSVLAQSGQNGVSFNQANDLTIGANGGIYFTDLRTQVFYLSPTRLLSVAASGLASANGIEWLPEQNAVYVNRAENTGSISRYSIMPNGSLINPTVFARMPVPDGGAVDAHGNFYVASYAQGEIRVFNARGDSLGFIRLRMATGSYDARAGMAGNTSNCAFGGPGNSTLYITGDGGLYSVALRIPGRARPGTSLARFRLAAPPARAGTGFDPRGRLITGVRRFLPALRNP